MTEKRATMIQKYLAATQLLRREEGQGYDMIWPKEDDNT
jgi:hypothetical protein